MSFGGEAFLGHDDQNSQCLHLYKAPPRFDAAQYSFFSDTYEACLLEGGIEDEVEESKGQKREEDHTWEEYQHEISVRLDQLTMRRDQPIKQPYRQKPNFKNENNPYRQDSVTVSQQTRASQPTQNVDIVSPQAMNLEDLERQMIKEAMQPQQQQINELQSSNVVPVVLQVQNSSPINPLPHLPPAAPPVIQVPIQPHSDAVLREQIPINKGDLQHHPQNVVGVAPPIMISPVQDLFLLQQQQQQRLFQQFVQQQMLQQQQQQQQQLLQQIQWQDNQHHGGNSTTPMLGKELVEWSLPSGYDGAIYMSKYDIGFVLRCSWQAIYITGHPYQDDYYFQAYVFKHLGINKSHFAPLEVKKLSSCDEKQGCTEMVEFVPVEGLGKIVRHRANTPKQLVEVSASNVYSGSMRLEQEPRLAIRVLIEDCFLVILDVEDIDRMLLVDSNRRDIPILQKRRCDLIRDLCQAMGLVENSSYNSDYKFQKLMELEKGRSLLSRVLSVVYPSWLGQMDFMVKGNYQHQVGLRAVWGVLRNLKQIFNAAIVENPGMLKKTHNIASRIMHVFTQLNDSQDILDSMNELWKGDLGKHVHGVEIRDIVCFVSPDMQLDELQKHEPWMDGVLLQLIMKGAEFGLANSQKLEWERGMEVIVDALLCLLVQIPQILSKVQMNDIVECYKRLIPKELIQVCMQQLVNHKKREQLTLKLHELGQLQLEQ